MIDTNRDLIQQNTSLVAQAVHEKARDGEGVDYAVSMTVVPGDQQNTFVPVLVVALLMNSPIVGDKIMSNILSFDLYMTREQIFDMISAQLEAMRAQRSQSLTSEAVDGSMSKGGVFVPR
jgi:hypothetical protein